MLTSSVISKTKLYLQNYCRYVIRKKCESNLLGAVINRALFHTHPHSPTHNQKSSHSPTPTYSKPRKGHTQPKKGHTQPQPLTPSQKKVTPTHTHPDPDKKGHTQPKEGHPHTHITEIKNVMCLTHTYKYSLFKILAGFFIFEKD